MQKLGQHFLRNQSVIVRIVEALEIGRGDTIVEIGPGHGELTISLARECAQKKARLIAIEKDGKLAAELSDRIRVAGMENLEIISGDIFDFLGSYRVPRDSSVKFVGNLPYYITGHLLKILGELKPRPERSIFMVQKEVAERMVAEPPTMNRLAASIRFWNNPKIIARISKKDFIPPPKVDSAVIAMKTKDSDFSMDAERYYTAVRVLFAQPRKTILNNISVVSNDSKKNITEKLLQISIDSKVRPQNLSIEDIVAVAKSLF